MAKISKEIACQYLKKLRGYTKNFKTGVRLCQCEHVYDIENTLVLQSCEDEDNTTKSFVKAKCWPTMQKNPPFYQAFICLAHDTTGGTANCMRPAGKSSGCVHVAALLLTLTKVTQTACTSIPCTLS